MDDRSKRSLLLIVIAVAVGGVYFATTYLMDSDEEPAGSETTEETGPRTDEAEATADEPARAPTQVASGATPRERPAPDSAARRALRQVGTIRTDHFEADIDNLGGGVSSFRLTGDERFTESSQEEPSLTNLWERLSGGGPLGPATRGPIDVITTDTDQWENYESLRVELGEIGIPASAVWELEQVSEREVRLTWQGNGVRVTRRFLGGSGPYQLWQTVRITNTAAHERRTRLEMETWHWVLRDDESGGFIASQSQYISHGVCVFGEEETERKPRDDLTEHGVHGYGNDDVHIAAVENIYFTQAMATTEPEGARCAISGQDLPNSDNAIGTLFRAQLLYPWVTIPPGGEQIYRTLAYLGPKDRPSLTLAGHDLPLMIDMGFFALIANLLADFLSFIHQYVPNWGLAIILLTLVIRLTLFPVTNLSFKSMAKMRRLKPEIDRITALYKDDAEKKGAATMELWRKHKVNPAAGCAPMIVQLPVFWALYASLSTNIELYHMPFTLWWTDLSAPDPYYVLPLLLGVLMHVQQRLSPTTMDPAQAKMMMYFMPVMITAFMLFLPSGLCLYMLTSSALGIGQMKLNEHRLDKELQAAGPLEGSGDDATGSGVEVDDQESGRPQQRRPKRKRRIRRGRA